MQFSNTNPASATGCQAVPSSRLAEQRSPWRCCRWRWRTGYDRAGLGQVAPGKADPRRSSTDADCRGLRMFFQGIGNARYLL